MLKIHGVNASPFVRKVRVALAEKGIAYELVAAMPGSTDADFRRMSPLGKIPCLEDDGYVLPDSSCIIAYLERTQPSPPLYPSDAKECGRALWYEEYSDSKLTDAIGPIFFNRYVKPNFFKQECDDEIVTQKLGELPPYFDYLEGEIGDNEYLVGNRFSVADIAVGSVFVNLKHAGEDVDASRWPKLGAYVERVHARPSFKQYIEEERANFS